MVRSKAKLPVVLFILLSCGASLALGAFVHKMGWHRPVLNPILNAFYNRVGFTCNRKMVNGFCPSSSKWRFEPYENALADQIDANVPDFSLKPVKGFVHLLKEAVGWHSFELLQQEGTQGESASGRIVKFEDGVIETKFIRYSFPKITLRFYHAKQSAENLIIVLHGHNSSALKVMGLDYPDYMRQAGKEWFRAGYDIIAFDLTTDEQRSAYINSQLLLYGGQIFGLWSRAVCDTMQISKMAQKYKKIFLYGLSNGGVIADYISVLCGQLFDKIIVDEALEDWRTTAWKHKSIWCPQNYAIFYLAPLHARSSYIDFVVNSKTQKYYILRRGSIEFLFMQNRKVLNLHRGVAHEKVINIVEKQLNHHVAELDIVMKILKDENDLTGYHLP